MRKTYIFFCTNFQLIFTLMIMNSPQAVVVSKGNGDSAWIKGQLTSTQEEVFIYPDDDKTIDVKALPIGLLLNIRQLRESFNKGPTKYTTTCHNLNLQTDEAKEFIAKLNNDRKIAGNIENTMETLFNMPLEPQQYKKDNYEKKSKLSVSISFQGTLLKWFEDTLEKKSGLEGGRIANSKLLEDIVIWSMMNGYS